MKGGSGNKGTSPTTWSPVALQAWLVLPSTYLPRAACPAHPQLGVEIP